VNLLRIGPIVAATILLVGCGHTRSILNEGVGRGQLGGVHRVDEKEAIKAGRVSLAEWERQLALGVRTNPNKRFANLPTSILRRRLNEEARRYDFDIVSFEIRRPRQLAPKIVVRTTHYLRLSEAMPKILAQIDPHANAKGDLDGWSYEGLYFRADDERGVPFMITSNFIRAGGGGQWARSERLYPFGHG
jgi:hypothetical protein